MDFERKIEVGRQDTIARRLILVGASTVVTIGFWGTVVTVDHHMGVLAAWICTGAGILVAGVALEMFLRRMSSTYKVIARQKSFERIQEFDKQLRQLENEIWLKRKRAREEAEEEGL